MNTNRVVIMFTLLVCISLYGDEQQMPWQKRHAEGWAWYHDFEEPTEQTIEEEIPKDPIEILGIAKEDLERSLAKAMLEPTRENILAYMILQKKWTNQSANFAKLWQQNILAYPELSSLTPTTQYGVKVRKQVDAATRKAFIQNLSSQTILLFFYEGGNAFSKAFASILKEFSVHYKWAVKAVSVDGIILSDFPGSIRDTGIAQEMQVNLFPSLFVVNKETMQAKPIAYGMATVSKIEENIIIQFKD